MADYKTKVIVDGDTDKAQKELKELNKELGKTGSIAELAIGNALGGALLAIPKLAGDAVRAMGTMVQEAMDFDQVRKTFDKLTDSIDATSDALMEDLREATHGLVNDMDLMTGANKLMAMGLAESAEEAAALSGMAVELGRSMGLAGDEAMEGFALLLSNESIQRLDSFGISSAKVRDRMQELIDAGEAIDRSDAFKMAVLEIGGEAMALFGDQGLNALGSLDRLKTGIDNLKMGIGLAILDAFGPLAATLIEFVLEHLPAIIHAIEIMGDAFAKFVEEQLPKLEKFFDEELGPKLEEMERWLDEDLPVAIAKFGAQWDLIYPALKGTWTVLTGIVGALSAMGQWYDEHQEAVDFWTEWFRILNTNQAAMFFGTKFGYPTGQGIGEDIVESQQGIPKRFGLGQQESNTSNNNFNLTINNPTGSSDIISDFEMMKALAGAH